MGRIVLVTTSFPESVPGSEAAGSFVADFAQTLSRKLEVSVVAPGVREGSARSGEVEVHRYRVPVQPLSLLRPGNPAHWPVIYRSMVNGQRTLRAILERSPVSHVLALWALPSGYWARRCMREKGIPYSIWALGSDIWTLGRIPLIRSMLRAVLRDASYRFADGLALADDVHEIGGKPCEFLASARCFPLSADSNRRQGPPYRLAFLGRWHPNKGIDLFLNALRQLPNAAWKDIEAVRIAGGGPLENQVRALCDGLVAEGRPLQLHGYMNVEQAADLFTWTDFVCIPSRIESIPVVFSDALQANRPVIASPVGDLPRLLEDGAAGVLAEAVTASAFSKAIQFALTRPCEPNAGALEKLRLRFDVNTIVDNVVRKIGQA